MLDDAGWSLLSIKLFIQHFLVHPTIFSCWMHLSSFSSIILPFNTALSAKHPQWSVFRTFEYFFHNQNKNKLSFKHRQLQARQGKKKNKANNMASSSDDEISTVKVAYTDQGTKRTFYIQFLKRIFEKLKISKTWLLSISSCYMLMW